MSGTKIGGIRARNTNYQKHGEDFYRIIGAKGGRNGHTGGFAADRERAREAGRKGGLVSRRGSEYQKKLDERADEILAMRMMGAGCSQIAEQLGVPYRPLYYWIQKRESKK